jgi:hypothetical protein
MEDSIQTAPPGDQQHTTLSDKVKKYSKTDLFLRAQLITNETFALVLRRTDHKNVLPHVHIMLAFLTSFASNLYVSHLLANIPWAELVAFLNALVMIQSQAQAQSIDTMLAAGVFPSQSERGDELPLPEDYLVRGLLWAQDYFPENWFRRKTNEVERYFEMRSTVKNRTERVLRLAKTLSQVSPPCWWPSQTR